MSSWEEGVGSEEVEIPYSSVEEVWRQCFETFIHYCLFAVHHQLQIDAIQTISLGA